MKKIARIGFVLVALVCVLVIGRNYIVRVVAEKGFRVLTGLSLSIRSIDIGLLDSKLHVTGVTIKNPKTFEERIMLDLPEVLIDYNVRSFVEGVIHLETVVLNLRQFNVVKNKEAKLNLDALNVVQQKKKDEGEQKPPTTEKKASMKFRIDNLELIVGSISFQDYSRKKPSIKTFPFDIHEKHSNITQPEVLAFLIINKALLKASASQITGFGADTLGELQGITAHSLRSALTFTDDVLETPIEAIAQLSEKSVDVVSETSEVAAETIRKSTKKVTSIFQKVGETLKETVSN